MAISEPVYLNAMGVICALGEGKKEVGNRLLSGDQSGMKRQGGYLVSGSSTIAGVVPNFERLDHLPVRHRSRNNAILLQVAKQIEADIETAIETFGADRVAVVMATSTTGIAQGEKALGHFVSHSVFPDQYDFMQQEISSPALFLADVFEIRGLAYTVSTACSSGANAIAASMRLLKSGLCDAVVVGGADTLCGLTMNGFDSLSILSTKQCNPFSRNRDGINLGEGAAVFIMTREKSGVAVAGVGESSDAYDMTAPEPDGVGAELAMRSALTRAGLMADMIDYISLHGTGTEQNDAMESAAILRVFGETVPCSSSKPQIGHTLGASGSIEAALIWLTLSADNTCNVLPPHLWDGEADNGLLSGSLVNIGQRAEALNYVLSNSFAFGGNNVSVIFQGLDR